MMLQSSDNYKMIFVGNYNLLLFLISFREVESKLGVRGQLPEVCRLLAFVN